MFFVPIARVFFVVVVFISILFSVWWMIMVNFFSSPFGNHKEYQPSTNENFHFAFFLVSFFFSFIWLDDDVWGRKKKFLAFSISVCVRVNFDWSSSSYDIIRVQKWMFVCFFVCVFAWPDLAICGLVNFHQNVWKARERER